MENLARVMKFTSLAQSTDPFFTPSETNVLGINALRAACCVSSSPSSGPFPPLPVHRSCSPLESSVLSTLNQSFSGPACYGQQLHWKPDFLHSAFLTELASIKPTRQV